VTCVVCAIEGAHQRATSLPGHRSITQDHPITLRGALHPSDHDHIRRLAAASSGGVGRHVVGPTFLAFDTVFVTAVVVEWLSTARSERSSSYSFITDQHLEAGACRDSPTHIHAGGAAEMQRLNPKSRMKPIYTSDPRRNNED
jgi:hypothetical protein